VSYSVNFIVNNASTFDDLNTDIVRQYLETRTGPMSSTGMSQVKYFQRQLFFSYLSCAKFYLKIIIHILLHISLGVPKFFSCESPKKLPLFIDNQIQLKTTNLF